MRRPTSPLSSQVSLWTICHLLHAYSKCLHTPFYFCHFINTRNATVSEYLTFNMLIHTKPTQPCWFVRSNLDIKMLSSNILVFKDSVACWAAAEGTGTERGNAALTWSHFNIKRWHFVCWNLNIHFISRTHCKDCRFCSLSLTLQSCEERIMTISVDKRTNHSDQEPFQQWETRRVGSSKKVFYFSVLKKT